jgi:hypothetical protein
MSQVRVEVSHQVPVTEIPGRLASFSQNLAKVGASLTWKGPRADVKGPGVSGEVVCGADRVTVLLQLGMLARVAGVDPGRLEQSIRKRLTEALQAG